MPIARRLAASLSLAAVLAAAPAAAPAADGSAPPLGAEPGATRVLPVKDGKRAAFLIQFDDAHMSQLPVVVPLLRERGLVGTFYLFDRKEHVRDRQDQWIKAAESGVVSFGNHTSTHQYIQDSFPDRATADKEISGCNELIRALTPGQPWPRLIPYGHAGGKTPADRGIGAKGTDEVLKANHLFRRPNFVGASLHAKTVDDMKKQVDRAVENGVMGHLDFHGVGKKSSINASKDEFVGFLDHVEANKDKLWVTDCASWHKYETERKTAKAAAAVAADGASIRVTLTSDADKALYDQPLTLETRAPAGWTKAAVRQGDRKAEAAVADGVIRYDATPNAGEVVIERGA